LVPARKQPGLKAGAFSPAWLVPVAKTGINGVYKPGLKAFFSSSVRTYGGTLWVKCTVRLYRATGLADT
jgi:hypothetical protein